MDIHQTLGLNKWLHYVQTMYVCTRVCVVKVSLSMSPCTPECSWYSTWKSFPIYLDLCVCVCVSRLSGFTCVLSAKPLCCRGDPEAGANCRVSSRRQRHFLIKWRTIPKEIHPHWDICTCVSPDKSAPFWQALISLCHCVCVCLSERIVRKKSASEMFLFALVVSAVGKKKIQLQGGQSFFNWRLSVSAWVEHMDD